MYFIELAQRYLLVIVAVTTLCSLSLDAMPLSWSKTVKHRRSADSSETEIPTLPTDAGTVSLHQQEVDATTAPGGGMDNKTFMHDCMKECYNYIPEEKLKQLRKKVRTVSPHPSFLLSEMAEYIHREKFCNSISKNDETIFCENENPQLSEDVKTNTTGDLLRYLNPNTDTTGQKYKIAYNADHYPRYLIQVDCPCTAQTKLKVAGKMFYLQNTTSGWDLRQHAEAVVGCQCSSC